MDLPSSVRRAANDGNHLSLGVLRVELADRGLQRLAPLLEVLGKLVVPRQNVDEDVVHTARASVVEEPNSLQARGLALGLHVPGLLPGQVLGRERPPTPGTLPPHRSTLMQRLRATMGEQPAYRLELKCPHGGHLVCQKLRALSGTAGSSATWIQMWTCGWPRKYHTNAGPSSRQLSHSPSLPISPSL